MKLRDNEDDAEAGAKADVNEFGDLNSNLANERPHLSVIRIALAFVTFGITFNRYGI